MTTVNKERERFGVHDKNDWSKNRYRGIPNERADGWNMIDNNRLSAKVTFQTTVEQFRRCRSFIEVCCHQRCQILPWGQAKSRQRDFCYQKPTRCHFQLVAAQSWCCVNERYDGCWKDNKELSLKYAKSCLRTVFRKILERKEKFDTAR